MPRHAHLSLLSVFVSIQCLVLLGYPVPGVMFLRQFAHQCTVEVVSFHQFHEFVGIIVVICLVECGLTVIYNVKRQYRAPEKHGFYQ